MITVLEEEGKDTADLKKWFRKDENRVPSVYNLLSITTHLPNFNNPEKPDLQRKEKDEWWATFERFQELLRLAAAKCVERGQMAESDKKKYFISGPLSSPFPCLFFLFQFHQESFPSLPTLPQ